VNCVSAEPALTDAGEIPVTNGAGFAGGKTLNVTGVLVPPPLPVFVADIETDPTFSDARGTRIVRVFGTATAIGANTVLPKFTWVVAFRLFPLSVISTDETLKVVSVGLMLHNTAGWF